MSNITEYAAIERLALTDSETDLISAKANYLEEGFAALASVDTSALAPLVTVLAVESVLREDVSTKMLSREDLLATAPEQYDGYFQVPKTLE
ncbi:MAG: Asp-tRNA(Asn)/Glu-tRNA(Gln) amidotransferase subunit GatC [Lachnospiraceae bacterium]|nr:Asp-tRNA(Asn)/Glu-tRNA(Gln) amidotransferase subunit GatC [Lachnospiraceae bacterium]